ncbi:tripartite tricarboxylate transporter TctB family protein [Pelagibius litoralis]|uniref:Tripartite tricarboxylate transporter TctB family protein n=1 Tax=Pelagibius litoralis TaxID=374515 RepID=A0A967EY42_9PROT|nr:tripartite tricarboxylate transporter TctB family protein [Pelagibius litoralis]NIA69566.1 tripartite tricarboxylate transporter TctB family protein [Pelagibius litoralis]
MISARVNSATVVGGALALFGATAIAASFGINPDPDGGWGARTFPLVGSGALLLLGLLEARKGLGAGAATTRQTTNSLPSVLALLLLSLAYVWVISKLGYLIGTGLAAPLALWLFSIRNPFGMVAAAIVCPAVYHAVFFIGLGVFPPLGEWFDLLDVIQGY